MVSKSADSSSTANRIKWTVVLNSGTLKANMGGYAFKDTLDDQQRYLPDGYTVTDESGNTILQGQTDPANNSLAFTMPNDADEKTYTVTYYTELKNPSDKKKAENSVTVTPPDSKHGPSGTATGTVGPFDSSQYVAKSVVNDSNAAKDGTAEWEAIIDFKAMSKDTDPSSIVFSDSFQYPTPNCNDMKFDAQSVQIVSGDCELKAGTDYVVESPNKYYSGNQLQIRFNATEAVKSLIGSADAVKVSYTTQAKVADGSGVEPGDYTNKATVQANTISKNNTASAKYTVRASAGVSKKGDAASWDANYTWADGSKGAWISTWEVAVNRGGGKDQYSWKGANDLLGQDVVVNDDLPDGSEYVAGSARYSLMKDGCNSESGKWELSVEPSLSAGKAMFTIPTSDVASDGHWVGWVKLTYQTAVKNPGVAAGESAEVTNSASASSGEIEFPKGTGTSKITNDVLEKKGEQRGGDAAVTYTINVNPHAFDLDSDSDSLTLVDTMDPKCTFVVGSLEVLDADGNALTEGVSNTLENVSVDNGVATRLTLTVPDSKALTVKYAVIPAGKEGDKVSLKNVCELKGFDHAGTTSDQNFVVGHVSGTTAGDSCGIQITKSDEVGNKLQGAKFELYCVDMDASKRGDIKAVKEASAQSDANGNISFGTKQDPLLSNTLYYFIETVPPEGYEITFKDPTYVMAMGPDAEEYAAEFKKAQALGINPSASSTFNVYDKKNEQPSQSPVAVELKAAKTVDGKTPSAAQEFEFELKDSTGKVLQTKQNVGGDVSFDSISYDEAGEHDYTISEKAAKGFDCDAKTVSVHVSVTKGGDGKLSAAVTYDGAADASTFENKELVSVPVAKKWVGRTGDKAEFQLIADGQDVEGKTLTLTEEDDWKGSFDGLRKCADDGHEIAYTVRETGVPAGYTSESSQKDGAWTFTNSYKAEATSASLAATKVLNGAELKAGEFEFQLKGSDGKVLQTKGNDAEGNVAFDAISYDEAGTYTYEISEVKGSRADVSYDESVCTATVEVVDDGQGKLVATVSYGTADGKTPTFTNSVVKTEPVSATLSVKKTVNGGNTIAADRDFSFSLYKAGEDGKATGNALATASVKPGKTAEFDALSFDKAGTYQYVIAEDGELDGGWTKPEPVIATVTVEAAGNGALSVKSVTYSNGKKAALFDNVYAASGSASVSVAKTVNGAAPADDQEFAFELTPVDGAPMPGGAKSLTATTKGATAASFPELAYALKDAGKTYTYRIHETTPATVGWTMAGDVTVKVTVGADRGDGTLGAATIAYSNGNDAALFNNKYEQAAGEFQLGLVKTVNGEAPLKGESFEFSATAEGDNSVDAPPLENVRTDKDGKAVFAAAKLSDKDAGKTYTYRIHEVTDPAGGNGTWAKAADVIATVKVSERSSDNKLTASVTYRADGSAQAYEGTANFDNTFKPSTAVASIAAGKKSVNGATDVKAGEDYTFGLYAKGEDGQRAGKALATVTTKLGETKVFDAQELSYDKPGTYEYLVHEENHNGEAGWSAVADVPVTVTVAPKGGSGADARDLVATVAYGGKANADAALFADAYAATGEAKLSVSKKVTGKADAVKDEAFAFELRDAKGTVLSTATAKAGETADFAPIAYDFADAGKTFEYTIHEVGHGSGAWFKPGDVKVTVAVNDKGNGQLAAKVTYDRANGDGTAALFENVYQPASAALKVTKTINGATEDNAAEEFAFELSARDGAPLPASTTLTVKGTSTGSFDKIRYTEPGTYRYAIHETSDLGAGWTNAGDVEATVTVERDEAVRSLKVTKVEYSNANDDATAALFDNRYDAKDVKVAFGATKTLSGATLKADQFEFVLRDADGNEVARAKNAADGAIAFPELAYSLDQIGGRGKSKTFEYTIEEVAGSEDGVTYDKAVHKVTVKVSDDGASGKLAAEVTYDGAANAPVFENTYTPHTPKESPKKPGGMPSTGDNAPVLASVIAAMGLLALAAGLKMTRRKRD